MIKKVSEDEYNELFRRVGVALQRFPNLRYGQIVFNEAHSMWPDFANELRGTDDDCFYRDDKVELFLSHLQISK